jgi:hypothetical protein
MSKMTKLLNKTQEVRDAAYSINAKDVEGVHTNSQQEDTYQPKQNHLENSPQLSQFSLGLMILVLLVAIASLVVSYRAVVEMNSSKAAALSLLDQIDVQNQRIQELKDNVLSKSVKESINIQELSSQILQMSSNLEKRQFSAKKEHSEVQRLVGEYGSLVETTEEVRTTNRLLLQKFISLNQEVQTLQEKMPFITAQVSQFNIAE